MERARIEDVVEKSGIELHKSGVNLKGLCPFHDDRNPSFMVSPSKNICHCFVCGKGGSPVGFVMEREGLSYPQAIKRVAGMYNIDVIETGKKATPEELELQHKRESATILMEAAAQFYAEQLHADTPKAKAALSYVNNRWSHCDPKIGGKDKEKDYPSMIGIGYAPDGWHSLLDFLRQKGYSLKIAEEVGLIRVSEKTHDYYDFYRDRVMLPVRDRYHRMVSFSARTLDRVTDKNPKYINGPESFIYHKSQVVFGLDIAFNEARKTGKVYLVEGGPDVIQLQSLDINNVVAPLGTAWTPEHFDLLKQLNATLCFIPDTDEVKPGEQYGVGIRKVMDSGKLAMERGFRVTVKEIPPTKDGKKQDADSFIKGKHQLEEMTEEDFVSWYAKKILRHDDPTSERARKIKDVCSVMLNVDEFYRNAFINELGEDYNGKAFWKSTIEELEKERTRKAAERATKNDDRDLLRKYGFYEEHNCYYSTDGRRSSQWNNFTMKPLIFIPDTGGNAKRIYELKNKYGHKLIVEFKQEELSNLQRFKQKIESLGNFLWRATVSELDKLKEYLYEETKEAKEIKVLGWSKAYGFWVWGNGIYFDGLFRPVDDVGVVTINRTNGDGKPTEERYYLPARSRIFAENADVYEFERNFCFEDEHASITLPNFSRLMVEVFGDNAKVGISFVLASLFCDIVRVHNSKFPLLNLFGPKGSGKSEFATTLMAFFSPRIKSQNIQNGTVAGLAESLAQTCNAIVHIDEYKNNIDQLRLELLKSAYDGIGRTRMKRGSYEEREVTKVESAVILSGQEMPTLDIALLTRTIHLSFDRSTHDREQKKRFDHLLRIRALGLTHLTNEIMDCRQAMEDEYGKVYKETLKDMEREGTEDRTWRSWSAVLAAYRLLYKRLCLPWGYDEMLKLMREGMRKQNDISQSSNEVGLFWENFENMISDGQIFDGCDFKLKTMRELKTDTNKEGWDFSEKPKRVLMVNERHVISQYRLAIRKQDAQNMGTESVKYYLRNHECYLGKKLTAERFKFIVGGQVKTVEKPNDFGTPEQKVQSKVERPLCFDYDRLHDMFGLTIPDDEEGEAKQLVQGEDFF